ncbi:MULTISPECIES: hypothetical protein [unclassified Pseudomonas]|uniref:hypothetical protein n=1 Tax=unclassified Pseudomonas TaxID=196821 RepID=UPI002AC901AB|nr:MULTISPECIES: hypothetical protein [unclassified Pseudomonas]MEB0047244.1 hypothetical protein [Pseudomonas sp. Dout3]MEB0096884.1 hypothetical protein [Pseudomonas sp. DC1.2]WPX57397.1 hypothetical protein RHM68_17430 [Pseudomonas sp. DC1.2]
MGLAAPVFFAAYLSASLFACQVQGLEHQGVGEFDAVGRAISRGQPPLPPKSNYSVTRVYFDDLQRVDSAKSIKPFERRELEITDFNRVYLKQIELSAGIIGRSLPGWARVCVIRSLKVVSMLRPSNAVRA